MLTSWLKPFLKKNSSIFLNVRDIPLCFFAVSNFFSNHSVLEVEWKFFSSSSALQRPRLSSVARRSEPRGGRHARSSKAPNPQGTPSSSGRWRGRARPSKTRPASGASHLAYHPPSTGLAVSHRSLRPG
jgi:hypothetical protein